MSGISGESLSSSEPVIKKKIITSLTRVEFQKILENNPGLFLLKLGATWCGPCQKIKPAVHTFFATSPPNVLCADIDIDDSFDLYAYLKSKKMVNGVPVILCYQRGNHTFAPNLSITGSSASQLDDFFSKCGKMI